MGPRSLVALVSVLCLLAVSQAEAQAKFTTGTITVNGGTVRLSTGETGNGTVQITGTWTGTLAFEATVDGSTWVALTVTPVPTTTAVTTTTGNGVWTYGGSFRAIRVRATATVTGTATVNLLATWAHTTIGPAGAGGAVGATGPTGATGPGGGLTQTFAVCTGIACATTCVLVYTGGVLTSATGTCPSS